MQRKTIEKVITDKFLKWLKSIEDENVKKAVEKNTIITGGCITSMLTGEPINDFDLYFTDKETTKLVAQYYVDKFNQKHSKRKNKFDYEHKAFVLDGAFLIEEQITDNGEELWKSGMLENIPEDRVKIIVRSDGVASSESSENPEEELSLDDISGNMDKADNIEFSELNKQKQKDTEKEKYEPVFLSTNAITLSDKVQIVIRFYGEPEEIHSNYDFVHCTNYWRSDTKKLYTNTEALEATLSKTLYYQGSKYPLCSIIRTRKFLKRGWHINAGQYLKMAMQLNELDLSDIHVLEEQLVGVDTMYFLDLIDRLRKKQLEDSSFKIESHYIVSIIDKIF